MKTELRALGSQVRIDLQIGKQPLFLLTLFIYISFWVAIMTGDVDRPRTVYYFSEMGMFPIVIMLTVLMFQREIGGGGMEVIATYPVSLRLMAVRKWFMALILSAVAGVGWMIVYRIKFGGIVTKIYSWSGGEAVAMKAGTMALLLQTLPAYMLLASLTIFGIVLFQRLYGGLALAFSLWMLDTVSGGSVLSRWTTYATYLPQQYSFVENRLMLITFSFLFLLLAAWIIGRRERWIGKEEE